MLTFTKDKEIPFAEITDFLLPSDFPHRSSGGHRGWGGWLRSPASQGWSHRVHRGLLSVCHLLLLSTRGRPAGHSLCRVVPRPR